MFVVVRKQWLLKASAGRMMKILVSGWFTIEKDHSKFMGNTNWNKVNQWIILGSFSSNMRHVREMIIQYYTVYTNYRTSQFNQHDMRKTKDQRRLQEKIRENEQMEPSVHMEEYGSFWISSLMG